MTVNDRSSATCMPNSTPSLSNRVRLLNILAGSTTMNALPTLTVQLSRVLDHIDENLESDLSVEVLSEVAGLSRFHFQRVFRHTLGLGVHAYVQHLRMRRAAFQLAFRGREILEVALEAGYASHEAFTRAFGKLAGRSPSAFRDEPAWALWREMQANLDAVRARDVELEVAVRDVAAVRVLAMEHRGDPRELLATVRRFIAWRRAARISPAHATYNIAYVDPDEVPPAEFRFDIAVQTDRRADADVVEKQLPGGRCATFRHVGRDEEMWRKVGRLYQWLATSGERPGDAPLRVQRIAVFPDVPEHAAISEVTLQLGGTPRSRDTGDPETRGDRSSADPWRAGSRASPPATD